MLENIQGLKKTIVMNIGQAIKTLRIREHHNQKDYASRIGITQSYLSLIENGKKNPSIEVLNLIADDFQIPLPIIFWFSIDENDVSATKVEIFKILKPIIDELLKGLWD